MLPESTRRRILRSLIIAVPLLAFILLVAPYGPRAARHLFGSQKLDESLSMSYGRPGQPGQPGHAQPGQGGQPGYAQPGQPGQPGRGQNGRPGQPGRPGFAQNGATSSAGQAPLSGDVVPWNVLPEGTYTYQAPGERYGQTYRYAADAAVDLPLSADTLYLAAQGSGFSGVVNINDDGQRGADVARVDIRMYYTAQRLAEDSKVWKEQPGRGQNGLRITTPHHCGQDENMFFDVKVHLPPGTPQNRQHISNFETDLPQFGHVLGDLANSLYFDRMTLRGANSRITSKSFLANIASLRTSNGVIEGRYSADSSLALQTTNGAISTDVTLSNGGGGTSVLDMSTTNGKLTSSVSLLSTAQGNSGGVFKVSAKSSNGPVSVSFPQAPLDSVQHIEAQSANGNVALQLHKTFEGEFGLQTSNAVPSVERVTRVQDPAGFGRQREIGYEQDRRGTVTGKATWGEAIASRVMGSVKVKTSNGDVKLVL